MTTPRAPWSVSEPERRRVDEIDRLFSSGAAAVPALIDGLADSSWTVRRAVVGSLAALGDDAVGALLRNLVSNRSNEAVVAALVEALVSSTGAVEAGLEPLVDHPDPAVVADVAQVLGRRHSSVAVPFLIRLAAHANDNVAVAAIEALGRVGSRPAVEALLTSLADTNFFRVFPAIGVLGRTGDPRVVKPLTNLLGNPFYALEAIHALGRTGDRAAVAPLANLLVSDPDKAGAVAQSLASLAAEHATRYGASAKVSDSLRDVLDVSRAAALLIKAAPRTTGSERAAIHTVLGMLGDESAVPFLVEAAREQGPAGRTALTALHEFGVGSSRAIAGALNGADSDVRRVLLPLISARADVAAVVACLEDEEPEVRAAAADALVRIGGTGAVPVLFSYLADASPVVVQSAVAAIQSLGSPDTEALALASATSENPSVRRWALRILGYFGGDGALDALLSAMSDSNPRVQESAIQGLALMESVKARDALLNAARHSTAQIRAIGYRSLGQAIPDPRVESALIRGMSDSDSWVRYYACQSAGRLRVRAGIQLLIERLSDKAPQVRLASIEALSHFEEPEAQQALEITAASSESDIRQAALIGLGIAQIGRTAIVNAMDAAVEPATRLVAVSALAGFEGADVMALLRAAATDADENVRNAALAAIAARPEPEGTWILLDLFGERRVEGPLLVDLLAQPSRHRVATVVNALERANDELAPLLTATLARQPKNAGENTGEVLLFKALRMRNPAARRAAAMTLGGVATPTALAAVRAALDQDSDPEVRSICAALLAPA